MSSFAEKHPKAAQWIREGGLFLIFSYVVTFLKWGLLTFLPGLFRGLVGDVAEGKLSIRNSYADCYVTGREAGGLVGCGPVNTSSNSYASGFLKSPVQSIGDAAGYEKADVRIQNFAELLELGR